MPLCSGSGLAPKSGRWVFCRWAKAGRAKPEPSAPDSGALGSGLADRSHCSGGAARLSLGTWGRERRRQQAQHIGHLVRVQRLGDRPSYFARLGGRSWSDWRERTRHTAAEKPFRRAHAVLHVAYKCVSRSAFFWLGRPSARINELINERALPGVLCMLDWLESLRMKPNAQMCT